jgi:hypothetical protein
VKARPRAAATRCRRGASRPRATRRATRSGRIASLFSDDRNKGPAKIEIKVQRRLK